MEGDLSSCYLRCELLACILRDAVKLTELTGLQVRRWLLAGLGTIMLGAIGSGVWQSLLGPALHISTRGLLDLASLGFASYKNSVYRQIGADNQFAIDVHALSLTTTIVFYMLVAICFYLFHQLRHVRRMLEKASTETDATQTSGVERARKLFPKVRVAIWMCALIAAVLVFQLFISQARLSYVNSADAHYRQMIRIAAPYMNTSEAAQIESDFAQIGSRQEYVSVLSRLEGIARDHGRNVPGFEPW
jgi:hypothetical protein